MVGVSSSRPGSSGSSTLICSLLPRRPRENPEPADLSGRILSAIWVETVPLDFPDSDGLCRLMEGRAFSTILAGFGPRTGGPPSTVPPMNNPPHPGKVVRVSCLEPLGLSVTEGARVLGVSRQALSNLVNGRARISGDMAIRLAKAFGSTTESWIRLQAAYDVAQAQAREHEIEVDRYEPQSAL